MQIGCGRQVPTRSEHMNDANPKANTNTQNMKQKKKWLWKKSSAITQKNRRKKTYKLQNKCKEENAANTKNTHPQKKQL